MKGTEAIRLMLTANNVDAIQLLGSDNFRKKTINKKSLSQAGLHVSAVELKSENWSIQLMTEQGVLEWWKSLD